jgi:hypothetical protein
MELEDYIGQSTGPLYRLATPARSSSCNCVFTYSVGNVIHISNPPVIPPEKRKKYVKKDIYHICNMITSSIVYDISISKEII